MCIRDRKWGHRKARNASSSNSKPTRTDKKLAKADKKWEKTVYSNRGAIAIHNKVVVKINPMVDALNFQYRNADLTTDNPRSRAYHKEFEKMVDKFYSQAVSEVHGTSPSGKKKAKYVRDANGERIVIEDADVKHEMSEPDLVLLLTLNELGFVVKINEAEMAHKDESDAFIAHFGVKGMKWGVRRPQRDLSPQPATASWKPGDRKIKTSGGKYQPPSMDAINASVAKQKAAKSGTKSLSNEELQALVTRMNLEQQYNKLVTPDRVARGKKDIDDIMFSNGKKQVNRIVDQYATRQVGKFLAKGATTAAAAAAPVVAKKLKTKVGFI